MKSVIENLEGEINALKNKVVELKIKIKNEQSKRSKMLQNLQVMEKDLNANKDRVEFLLNNSDTSTDCIQLREVGTGRRFTEAVRLTYMALQGDANVSAENCAKVVQIVSKKIFQKDIHLNQLAYLNLRLQ